MKIFDSHLHIIDKRFPISPNQGYIPDYFSSKDYLKKVDKLNVVGGAIVSGSFQGFDQTYLVDALNTLGENFVGVTQLPFNTTDDEILRLNDIGVRALRFNVNRGGSEDISRLDYFARRVYELVNWHTELYINSNQLLEIKTIIENLPAVSIDHLGLSKSGFNDLLSFVDKGIKIKATGFGRIDFKPIEAIQSIYSLNPDALMFGTDLPSTRAKRPFHDTDVDIIINNLEEKQAKVLFKNAQKWYLK
ncbi:amidohydrolase family protein [Chengkuizengella marina]|uniref:2-pyrone-4,6-dicarboxylate hydrolase n=1 Tax=Chengkuizengella marina TaxID=2507566 RepID=A0A6N9PYU6_9BACL|nr:amidohydrolase family protein [Chengkuizengella marina]NBI28137.1 2-pyrone-4,6-dicarboxylate hydrolase [Chengkuizengella marina]